MKIGKVGYAGIGFAVFVAGYFIYKFYNSEETFKPKMGHVVESIYGLGTVTADQVFRLRSGVTLDVRKLFVKEGDLVKPNDPLVQFDDNVMRSTIVGTVTAVAFKEGELVTPQVPSSIL